MIPVSGLPRRGMPQELFQPGFGLNQDWLQGCPHPLWLPDVEGLPARWRVVVETLRVHIARGPGPPAVHQEPLDLISQLLRHFAKELGIKIWRGKRIRVVGPEF